MKMPVIIRIASLSLLSLVLLSVTGCNSDSADAAVKEEAPKKVEKPRVKSKGQEQAAENMFDGNLNPVEQRELNKILENNARAKEIREKKIFGGNPFKRSQAPPSAPESPPPSSKP